ncbi:NAD(P)-dependent oxidoreductase [Aquiluna sp.]|jgi:nucleoside-diphosphate-sugar epimerase|nr:NAD(P)-dependent oxidoreductase [Aquiluna sp.]
MRSVLVTGGSGKLGKFVVRHLMESGWNVTSIDRVPHPDSRVWSTIVDLLDSGSVMDLMTGANERHSKLDAVVHLAAIPAPGLQSDKATINNNLNSTLNVFMAARNAGIKKVVFASSETVLGLPFDTPPPYVPVDEEYEPRPESFYSLSKVLEERLAKELCRWDHELSMVGLRFSNVIDPIEYPSFEDFQDDAIKRKWNLWGYIDARDGALAVEKALDYETPGFEPFIIASPDSVMRMTNTQLLQEVFPEVALRRQVSEHETLLGIEKAKRLLGFNPSNSWRDL